MLLQRAESIMNQNNNNFKQQFIMKALYSFLTIGLVLLFTSCGKRPVPELLVEYNREASKEAQIEAAQYKKAGYKTFLGELAMERQFENVWVKIVDLDDLGYPKFIVGHAQVTAGNITAAKSQALHAAKVEIAALTSSMIATLVESSVANSEITPFEAQSLITYLQTSKELIQAEIGQVTKDLEIYRELPNKNIDLIVRVSYNAALAMEAAKRMMAKDVEVETIIVKQKLEEIFDLQRLQPESNTNINIGVIVTNQEIDRSRTTIIQ